MSEEHVILSEFPLVVTPVDLRLAGKPFIRNYRWEPERGLHFHVVEKDTGRIVRSVTADAGFAFIMSTRSLRSARIATRAAKPFAARRMQALGLRRLRLEVGLALMSTGPAPTLRTSI
jgi:hypothetical protein